MRTTSRMSVVLNILSAFLSCNTILILFSSLQPQSCLARDNITTKSRLVDGETLVSDGSRFELGFFGPSKSSNVMMRYVGIWYASNPEIVVWVANRDKPVSDRTGVLSIADGQLKVSDEEGNLYWSTQLAVKRSSLVAKLNDTGNFILLDGRLEINLWQSFDQPTDTFLFGMKMDELFFLTSWRSKDDPSPGNFTFKQDPEGRDQLVVMEKSTVYWRSSKPDPGQIIKSDEVLPPTIVNFLNLSHKQDYQDKRMVMNFTGHLQYWQLDSDMKSWSLIWWEPTNNCSVFNFCGNFGTCNSNTRMPCKCLPGFRPKFLEKWNAGDFSDGCSTNHTTSSCGSDFLSLKRMKVSNSDSQYEAKDETECKDECQKKCQCQAYSFVSQRVDTTSCLIWSEDLKNLQEDQEGGYDLHVRVALSDIESTAKSCETCGTNLVPYPLSTRPNCGDPMYFSFYCDNNTGELSFMAPNRNYSVVTVDPNARTFVIQMKADEADNCAAMNSSGSRILQLNQSSPFNMTSSCSSNVGNLTSNSSSLEGTVEVELRWKPPLEPICTSSADCKDWPQSTCNETGNGQRRCLCNTSFRWDGSALNCTKEAEQLRESPHKPLPLILGVSVPTGIAFLCAVVLIYSWRKKVVKRREKQRKAVLHMYDTEKGVKELIDLRHFEGKDHRTGIDVPFFDFESIQAATNNFSEENKLGKGGFGPVYMGKFPGGEEVAVKRLSSGSGQGLEEFKNEVVLIAKLQHRNLVRLLGYCIRGEEKILLYEYMPNKSLDALLFGESSSQQLDWSKRFNIILGIARGLLYLHQDSRLRIIHRDLKTSNILLDAEMNPKISDFGLARMIQGNQTEATTLRLIGTYGYMAPEYALDGVFSVKSDVFSFGIVMLEIISGIKSMRFYQVEDAQSLVGYGWKLWQEGNALDLMEDTVRSSCNESEFMRCVHVGLLCVQEDPSERPTMSDVVLMLGTQVLRIPMPKQPAYVTRRPISSTFSNSVSETNTEITSSIEQGR